MSDHSSIPGLVPIPPLLLHIPVVPAPTDPSILEDFSFEVNDEILATYQHSMQAWVESNSVHDFASIEDALDVAMRLFNAENFTGELSDAEAEYFEPILHRFRFGGEIAHRFVQRLLCADGEMPSPCVKFPALLIASLALVKATIAGSSDKAIVPPTNIWRLRVLFRHQLCLGHRAHSLFQQLATCVEAIQAASCSPESRVELGYVQNYYHRRDLAAEQFMLAMRESGLQIEESAMLGVRTRWQQHQMVQAVLLASSKRTPDAVDETLDQPVTIGSEKDGHDLLDRPRENPEGQAIAVQPLHVTDKAIIMALCVNIKNLNPHHGLTTHHMQTYIERLIVDPGHSPFSIRSQMLLIRCRLEHNRSRVAQRSFLQMQELVDQFFAQRNPTLPTFHRTDSRYLYLVALPSIWDFQSEFGTLCFEENLFKTALDLFEKIQNWEKIIECCKKLDKRKKAESLARDLLEKDPKNPMLWVALGEATREDEHLWKAWELSRHKMASPMRALAKLAVEREHYDKVVQYFEEAVRINPVFGGDWFTLGYASLRLKNLERSGEAFTRVCQIDPNDAFAWNNLSSIMLQQGKQRPAFNAMSQALRNNRRSWRMWQNYFSIGVELLEVTEATHALGVALEIAQRSIKLEPSTMKRFVSAAIRYMKGEIEGCDNVKDDDHEAEIPHHTAANEEEQAAENALEEEMGNLLPLGYEVEMPATFFPEKVQKQQEEADRIRAAIVSRYKDRIRQLFRTILEMFVTDAELYHCAAELHRYLDGPLASFEVRQKELRCAEQVEQWNRTEDRFVRVMECLERMLQDVQDSVSTPSAAPPPPVAVPTTMAQEEPTTNQDPNQADGEEAEQVTTFSKLSKTPIVDITATIAAGRALVNHIDAALEQSTEHLEHTEAYRQGQILRKKANMHLKECIASTR